jgi:hypothetical protein
MKSPGDIAQAKLRSSIDIMNRIEQDGPTSPRIEGIVVEWNDGKGLVIRWIRERMG